MDLAQLRSDARTITGYPERGNSGSTRLNNVITLAMRQLWREVPERYLSESFRIRAEPLLRDEHGVDQQHRHAGLGSSATAPPP